MKQAAHSLAERLSKETDKSTGDSSSKPLTSPSAQSATQRPSTDKSSTNSEGPPYVKKLHAVKALQLAVRSRLGLPTNHDNAEKEPCAWKALTGDCTRPDCQNCTCTERVPADILADIRSKCKQGLLKDVPAGSSGSA